MPRASQKRLPSSTQCSQASETAEKHSAETSSVQQSSQHTSFDLVRAILDSKRSTQKQYPYPPTIHRSQNITYTFLYRNLDAIIKTQCFFQPVVGHALSPIMCSLEGSDILKNGQVTQRHTLS